LAELIVIQTNPHGNFGKRETRSKRAGKAIWEEDGKFRFIELGPLLLNNNVAKGLKVQS
jgi:hypothetical protein